MASMYVTSVCVLHLFILFFSQLAATEHICESGRYYFGNMNTSFVESIHLQGFYVPTVITYMGRTVYQLETPDENEISTHADSYLYFHESAMNATYWLIGNQIGAMNARFSIESSSEQPETRRTGWYVRTSSGWVPERGLRLVCVGEKKDVCKTGTLRMSGTSATNTISQDRMGLYHLLNETHHLRPIYKHESAQTYLFHDGGLWMIGPDVHQPRSSMFVPDYAFRPELILRSWVTFNGFALIEDSNIKVTCEGLHDIPDSAITRVTSVGSVRYVNGGYYSEEDADEAGDHIVTSNVYRVNQSFCDTVLCYNGGSCVESEDGTSFWCRCDEYHFGALCEKEVMCGPPPEVANAYLDRVTSRAFLGLALYTCDPGYVNVGSASVCAVDATWRERPVCQRHNATTIASSRILSAIQPNPVAPQDTHQEHV